MKGYRLNREFESDRAAAAKRWDSCPKLTQPKIVNSPYAVAVFTAAWDRGWKLYGPVVDQVSERFGHSAVVGFVDTDAEGPFVQQLGLTTVPVSGFFREGEAIALHAGWHLDLERMTELLVTGHDMIPCLYMKSSKRGRTPC